MSLSARRPSGISVRGNRRVVQTMRGGYVAQCSRLRSGSTGGARPCRVDSQSTRQEASRQEPRGSRTHPARLPTRTVAKSFARSCACHCEERSDEAISIPGRRLLRCARNDMKSARSPTRLRHMHRIRLLFLHRHHQATSARPREPPNLAMRARRMLRCSGWASVGSADTTWKACRRAITSRS